MAPALREQELVASSSTATAALSSAPRIVGPPLVTMPSSTTGSIGPLGGTVSRWAHRKIGSPPSSFAGSRARTFPKPSVSDATPRPRR